MIKNKKFVFVHPKSKIANKLTHNLISESLSVTNFSNIAFMNQMSVNDKGSTDIIVQHQTNKIDSNSFDVNIKEKSQKSTKLNKSKIPRGSPYRGVSRNGHSWQVIILFLFFIGVDNDQ